ncbi:alpha/beta fold hydrolase [Aquibacillus koreensis]|uniref:Alpha/beta fold hydrolase n=1 Tax=Aquibacillus koreensis TaxID=279446 RepID=A0A9X4AHM8_9BACI|nr:alpha/beta hydrolase [Aquibacillus koreensis]MCT2537143.1 alpha/beta fold hydrolase [Aquibacillus koreensis]MDC3419874.1 alpha/beta fold hydrolase [Aquibacillus koreensis]
MPLAPVNGHNMYYEWSDRSGSKEVLLLIHGLALDSSCWGRFIELLGTDFSIVQYDIRGHGQSHYEEGPITWEDLCEDLNRLITKFELPKVHIAAFGYGTHVAVKYAREYPDQVKALTLMSLPYMATNNAHYHLARNVFPHMKQTMEAGHPHFLHQYEELLRGYTTLGPDHSDLRHYFQVLLSHPAGHFSNLVELTSNSALLLELADLSCPVLLLTGELNMTSPNSFLNASSFLLQNSTLVTVPNASFLLFIEQPELVSEWVRLFATRISVDTFSRKESQQFIQMVFQPEEQIESRRVPIIALHLLHRFSVEIDSIPIESGWNQRHAKRLLTYLAFHPVTTRDILCEELFPHLAQDKAKANLKVCLHHLAKLLRHPIGSMNGLLFQHGTVSLRYKIKCDLVDFVAVVRQAYLEKDSTIRYELCKQLPTFMPETILVDNYDDWAVSLRNEIDAQLSHLREWMETQQ